MPHTSVPTIAQALHAAQQQGLARMDAQLLLLHALGQDGQNRAWLLAHDGDALAPAQLAHWQALVARRLRGEPVAYLRGFHEFFGLKLAVDARVLDPRPDTETLVEWALQVLPPNQPQRVLDLGTGSGAVALAIRSQRPLAQLSATDASPDALAVAQANATTLQLPLRLLLSTPGETGDPWWNALHDECFDLIASNPPYIAEGDPHLAALAHEPRMALTSGADGLDAIRAIIQGSPRHLHAGGWLLLEHGYHQADAVQALLQAQGFIQVQTRNDLAGVPRCTGGQWPGP